MFNRNIFSFLLVWIMLASLIVSSMLQLVTVHAETNQEQENGIEYVNKKLGFSLTIPKSWEGKYKIEEEDGHVRFIFNSKSEKYDIPPLFTISYETKKEDGWNKGLRWMDELGTKGDMGYYYYYDALHLYRDGIPPGEEQDTILTMVGQISKVFESFKMLEIETEEATKQEQVNGIKYVNAKLRFSLTLPESWRDKYIIEETEDNNVIFSVKHGNKAYDNVPLFTIHVYNEELDKQTEGGEGSLLGTNNGKSYWITVDHALYQYDRYNELFPDATDEEREMIANMNKQIQDIGPTFEIVREEAKSKKDATKQEQAKGIEYVNEKLGFSLTIPGFWKENYIVEENEQGGVTFKFKFDGKVYDDIYLFNIYVVDKEYSNEEQEELGDKGVLGIGNGKTYLITENLAMEYYNNYDEYFASVPKEGRNVIKAMSKQKKILNFNVLERATAEEAKGDDNISENYDYYLQPTTILFDDVSLRVIKTPIDNIRTEVIKRPVSETNYMGINGGYYYTPKDPETDKRDYNKMEPCSMSYYKTDGLTDGYKFNGCPDKHLSLPTFVTYYDKDLKKTKAEIFPVKSMKDINNHFKNLDHNDHHHHSNQVIINAIGGKGFDLEQHGVYPFTWDDLSSIESFKQRFKLNFKNGTQYIFPLPVRRTVLGFQEEGSTIYAYLMITLEGVSIEGLRYRLKELGFDEENCIILDGSGSSSMRVFDKKINDWVVDKGTEPGYDNPDNANRHSYNMIRLIE
ncbi:hypothetical protein [Bacillus cereus]|uniref:hypothetical protein n=1 Tax=Bacillus cereus TaxID=1396 RepID=UPI00397EE4B5